MMPCAPCPIARGAIRDREENMNRPSVFSTSVLMVLGVALLPSNVVGQQRSIKEQLVGDMDVRLPLQPNFRTAVRREAPIQKGC